MEDLSLRTGHCKDSLTLLEGGARCKLNNIAKDFWLGKTNETMHRLLELCGGLTSPVSVISSSHELEVNIRMI